MSDTKKSEKPDIADLLYRTGENDTFLRNEQGEVLVLIPNSASAIEPQPNGQEDGVAVGEYVPIDSKRYSAWLIYRLHLEHPEVRVKAGAIKAAVLNLAAKPQFTLTPQRLYRRFAYHAGTVYLNLGGMNGQFVKVTAEGWSIETGACPVHFRYEASALEIPAPERGGSLDLLARFLNLNESQKDELQLIVGWLLTVLRGYGPYPPLLITGPQGAAKSTTTTILRQLVDPVASPLSSPPQNVRDLEVLGHNNGVLCLNNVSHLSPEMSDACCRMSTEGGSARRKLYSDSTQVALDNYRPIILNGINRLAERPDLLDRSIQVELQAISVADRRFLEDFKAEFERERPAILGALLDGLVAALAGYDSVVLDEKPRMADFVRFGTAAESAFGWESGSFAKAFARNQHAATNDAAESSRTVMAIRGLMKNRNRDWTGSAIKLLDELKAYANPYGKLPPTVAALGRELRRCAPTLLHFDVDLQFERDAKARTIRIQKIDRPSLLQAA